MYESVTKYKFYNKIKELRFVDKILLFGSRARGDNLERSDIDIAVYCPSATNQEWSKVLEIVDDADTLLKIDCLRFDKLSASSPIKQRIEEEGVPLYVRPTN